MTKFDTCFFERYARLSLISIVGKRYECLINEDRPDLQSPDHKSIGVEVTRAMEESRNAAKSLLKEMAGLQPEDSGGKCDRESNEDFERIISSGYGFGLQRGKYIGTKEYEYWSLAMPLRRIIESKVRKAGNGFYGSFEEMGLYIFCKDDMSDESVCRTCSYITDLQKGLKTGYDFLFLSETDSLYVCDLRKSGESGHAEIRRYPISQAQRKDFFINAIKNQELRKTAIA